MLANISTVLSDRCGLDQAHPIVVGVSGGPDSLCLLNILHSAGYAVLAAHFNHRLRTESDAEALHVEKTAARLKLGIGSLFVPLFGLANSTQQLAGRAGEAALHR